MTNIEIKACEALVGISRTMRERKIDWEQRRYEVARELFRDRLPSEDIKSDAKEAIAVADIFITALKEREGIETNDQSEL